MLADVEELNLLPSPLLLSPLLFPCSVGDQTQGLIFAGKFSGRKQCLQSDVELNSTDAKIAGSGKVFRKLKSAWEMTYQDSVFILSIIAVVFLGKGSAE